MSAHSPVNGWMIVICKPLVGITYTTETLTRIFVVDYAALMPSSTESQSSLCPRDGSVADIGLLAGLSRQLRLLFFKCSVVLAGVRRATKLNTFTTISIAKKLCFVLQVVLFLILRKKFLHAGMQNMSVVFFKIAFI